MDGWDDDDDLDSMLSDVELSNGQNMNDNDSNAPIPATCTPSPTPEMVRPPAPLSDQSSTEEDGKGVASPSLLRAVKCANRRLHAVAALNATSDRPRQFEIESDDSDDVVALDCEEDIPLPEAFRGDDLICEDTVLEILDGLKENVYSGSYRSMENDYEGHDHKVDSENSPKILPHHDVLLKPNSMADNADNGIQCNTMIINESEPDLASDSMQDSVLCIQQQQLSLPLNDLKEDDRIYNAHEVKIIDGDQNQIEVCSNDVDVSLNDGVVEDSFGKHVNVNYPFDEKFPKGAPVNSTEYQPLSADVIAVVENTKKVFTSSNEVDDSSFCHAVSLAGGDKNHDLSYESKSIFKTNHKEDKETSFHEAGNAWDDGDLGIKDVKEFEENELNAAKDKADTISSPSTHMDDVKDECSNSSAVINSCYEVDVEDSAYCHAVCDAWEDENLDFGDESNNDMKTTEMENGKMAVIACEADVSHSCHCSDGVDDSDTSFHDASGTCGNEDLGMKDETVYDENGGRCDKEEYNNRFSPSTNIDVAEVENVSTSEIINTCHEVDIADSALGNAVDDAWDNGDLDVGDESNNDVKAVRTEDGGTSDIACEADLSHCRRFVNSIEDRETSFHNVGDAWDHQDLGLEGEISSAANGGRNAKAEGDNVSAVKCSNNSEVDGCHEVYANKNDLCDAGSDAWDGENLDLGNQSKKKVKAVEIEDVAMFGIACKADLSQSHRCATGIEDSATSFFDAKGARDDEDVDAKHKMVLDENGGRFDEEEGDKCFSPSVGIDIAEVEYGDSSKVIATHHGVDLDNSAISDAGGDAWDDEDLDLGDESDIDVQIVDVEDGDMSDIACRTDLSHSRRCATGIEDRKALYEGADGAWDDEDLDKNEPKENGLKSEKDETDKSLTPSDGIDISEMEVENGDMSDMACRTDLSHSRRCVDGIEDRKASYEGADGAWDDEHLDKNEPKENGLESEKDETDKSLTPSDGIDISEMECVDNSKVIDTCHKGYIDDTDLGSAIGDAWNDENLDLKYESNKDIKAIETGDVEVTDIVCADLSDSHRCDDVIEDKEIFVHDTGGAWVDEDLDIKDETVCDENGGRSVKEDDNERSSPSNPMDAAEVEYCNTSEVIDTYHEEIALSNASDAWDDESLDLGDELNNDINRENSLDDASDAWDDQDVHINEEMVCDEYRDRNIKEEGDKCSSPSPGMDVAEVKCVNTSEVTDTCHEFDIADSALSDTVDNAWDDENLDLGDESNNDVKAVEMEDGEINGTTCEADLSHSRRFVDGFKDIQTDVGGAWGDEDLDIEDVLVSDKNGGRSDMNEADKSFSPSTGIDLSGVRCVNTSEVIDSCHVVDMHENVLSDAADDFWDDENLDLENKSIKDIKAVEMKDGEMSDTSCWADFSHRHRRVDHIKDSTGDNGDSDVKDETVIAEKNGQEDCPDKRLPQNSTDNKSLVYAPSDQKHFLEDSPTCENKGNEISQYLPSSANHSRNVLLNYGLSEGNKVSGAFEEIQSTSNTMISNDIVSEDKFVNGLPHGNHDEDLTNALKKALNALKHELDNNENETELLKKKWTQELNEEKENRRKLEIVLREREVENENMVGQLMQDLSSMKEQFLNSGKNQESSIAKLRSELDEEKSKRLYAENELKLRESSFGDRISKLVDEAIGISEELNFTKTQLDKTTEEKNDLEKILKEAKAENDLWVRDFSCDNTELRRLQNEVEKHQNIIFAQEERIIELKMKNDKTEYENADVSARLLELNNSMAALQTKNHQIEIELERKCKDYSKLEIDNEDLLCENTNLKRKVAELEALPLKKLVEDKASSAAVSELEQQLSSLKEKLDVSKNTAVINAKQFELQSGVVNGLKNRINELLLQGEIQSKDYKSLKDNFLENQALLSTSNEEKIKFQEQLNGKQQILDETVERNRGMKDEIDLLKHELKQSERVLLDFSDDADTHGKEISLLKEKLCSSEALASSQLERFQTLSDEARSLRQEIKEISQREKVQIAKLKDLESITHDRDDLMLANSKLESQAKLLESQIQNMSDTANEDQFKVTNLENTIANLKSRHSQISEEAEQYRIENEEILLLLSLQERENNAKVDDMHMIISDQKSCIQSLQLKIDKLETDRLSIEVDEIRNIETLREQMADEVESLKNNLRIEEGRRLDHDIKLSEMEKNLDDLKSRLELSERNLDASQVERLKIEEDLRKSLNEVSNLVSKKEQMSLEVESLRRNVQVTDVISRDSETDDQSKLKYLHEKINNLNIELTQKNQILIEKDHRLCSADVNIETLKHSLYEEQSTGKERELIIKKLEKDLQDLELAQKIIKETHVPSDKLQEHEAIKREFGLLKDAYDACKHLLGTKESEIKALVTEMNEIRMANRRPDELSGVSILHSSRVNIAVEDVSDPKDLKKQIFALASLLERSELQRADILERIIKERKSHAERLKQLSDSVKRFYATISYGDIDVEH